MLWGMRGTNILIKIQNDNCTRAFDDLKLH